MAETKRMESVPTQDGTPRTDGRVAEVWMTGFSAMDAPWLVDRAARLLNAEEQARAARMRLARARSEFLLGRAILRSLLAQRLRMGVQAIPLVAVPQHKPRLIDGHDELAFNLSHANGHIAIALTPGVACGIDLEWHDPAVEFLEIAAGHFSMPERAALLRAGRPDAIAALFYRVWTRKEAVVKAAGDGLTLPLDGFDVSSLTTGELGLAIDSLESGPTQWHVRDLQAPEGFCAAFAAAQPGLEVRQSVLTPDSVASLLESGLRADAAQVA